MTPSQLTERYGFMLSSAGTIHLPNSTKHVLSVSQKETFLHNYLDSVYFLANGKEVYPKGIESSVRLSNTNNRHKVNPNACVIMIEGI